MTDYRPVSNLATYDTLTETDRLVTCLANGAVRAANSATALVGVPLLAVNSTPANSSITVSGGRVFCDSDYLYVATANGALKRIALESF